MTNSRMIQSCLRLLAICAVLFATAGTASAQQPTGLSWDHHDWGRFRAGSWQKIRVVTEHLSPQGEVVSTTTTEKLTRMVRSNRRAVTLRTTAMMEVAGKQFEAPPHDFLQGNHGEPVGQTVTAKELGETELDVEGRRIACRVRQYEITNAEQTKVVKIYYSDKVAPFILKREEIATAGEGKRNESLVSVTALGMPHKVLAEILPTSYVKEVHKNGKSTTTTLAVYAQDVPGGMVAYTSRETDSEGRLVRRSTAELVDYGFSRIGGGGDFRLRRGFRQRLPR